MGTPSAPNGPKPLDLCDLDELFYRYIAFELHSLYLEINQTAQAKLEEVITNIQNLDPQDSWRITQIKTLALLVNPEYPSLNMYWVNDPQLLDVILEAGSFALAHYEQYETDDYRFSSSVFTDALAREGMTSLFHPETGLTDELHMDLDQVDLQDERFWQSYPDTSGMILVLGHAIYQTYFTPRAVFEAAVLKRVSELGEGKLNALELPKPPSHMGLSPTTGEKIHMQAPIQTGFRLDHKGEPRLYNRRASVHHPFRTQRSLNTIRMLDVNAAVPQPASKASNKNEAKSSKSTQEETD